MPDGLLHPARMSKSRMDVHPRCMSMPRSINETNINTPKYIEDGFAISDRQPYPKNRSIWEFHISDGSCTVSHECDEWTLQRPDQSDCLPLIETLSSLHLPLRALRSHFINCPPLGSIMNESGQPNAWSTVPSTTGHPPRFSPEVHAVVRCGPPCGRVDLAPISK